jgi:hypothetical protein
MLTGFFYIALKYIRIKMLGCAINVNHATSFAGFLIRKDDDRRGNYVNEKFDFLGYTFRPRRVKARRRNRFFVGFNPALMETTRIGTVLILEPSPTYLHIKCLDIPKCQ